jgi:hypothetical protein
MHCIGGIVDGNQVARKKKVKQTKSANRTKAKVQKPSANAVGLAMLHTSHINTVKKLCFT